MAESKYWVWTARETSELKTETLPAPSSDEVLVKTRFTAVSPGTEMALFMMTHVGFGDPNDRYAKYPHRGGYLNIGVIEAAGEKVVADWPVGTWVFSSAGHCQYSIRKPAQDVWSSVFRLPESLHGPQAGLVGMVRIGYTAEYLAPARLGETVTVLGAGLVGNFAAQIYNVAGANTLVVERDVFRADIASRCGLAVVPSIDDVAKHFGAAPQIVVEATGVPQLCVEAMKLCARKGRVVILSSPRGEAPVNFYTHIHQKCIQVIGAHANGIDDATAAQKLVIALAADGRVKLQPCLTHVASWQDAPEIWNIYARGPEKRLGTALDWSK